MSTSWSVDPFWSSWYNIVIIIYVIVIVFIVHKSVFLGLGRTEKSKQNCKQTAEKIKTKDKYYIPGFKYRWRSDGFLSWRTKEKRQNEYNRGKIRSSIASTGWFFIFQFHEIIVVNGSTEKDNLIYFLFVTKISWNCIGKIINWGNIRSCKYWLFF